MEQLPTVDLIVCLVRTVGDTVQKMVTLKTGHTCIEYTPSYT